MPFFLTKNDITKMRVDAIVNAANTSLSGGGGVDGAIHRAAGAGLAEECRRVGGCEVGAAVVTDAYSLPCRHVIHTVGPVWQGGNRGETELLKSCYDSSLALAKKLGCDSVAFPLISAGAFGVPKDIAFETAVNALTDSPFISELTVYLVIFEELPLWVDPMLKEALDSYEKALSRRPEICVASLSDSREKRRLCDFKKPRRGSSKSTKECLELCDLPADESELAELLKNLDESFSQSLLRLIDQKGLTDAQCYKKANIDRKLFSKIRSDLLYRPSKLTALAFAVALELDLTETQLLLKKAGYTLSDSNRFDVIVKYFICKGNYNIFEINEALFAYDQALLGA